MSYVILLFLFAFNEINNIVVDSKKQVQPEILSKMVKAILNHAKNVRKRPFTETIEIHFGLKNFDPARDRRIAGTTQLPHPPRKKFKCLILGNVGHIDEAKSLGMDYRSLEDLKKVNRDKKVVKALGMSSKIFFVKRL